MSLPRKIGKPCARVAEWIPLFAAFGYLAWFLWNRLPLFLDADMSSELVLAKLLSGQNAILTTDWYYSTELRVLNTQLIFTPLFEITSNWHLVRTVGTLILCGILLAALYTLCRSLRIGGYFPLAAVALTVPFCYEYGYAILWGSYYYPHVIISFFALAMTLACVKAKKRTPGLLWLGGSFLLALIAGLGGARQVIVFYLPLFCAGIAPLVIDAFKSTRPDRDTVRFAVIAGSGFIGAMAGYFLNTRVLSNTYGFLSWSDLLLWQEPGADHIAAIFNGYLRCLGFCTGEVLSADFLRNAVCAVWLLLSIAAVVRGLRRDRETSREYRLLARFTLWAFAVFTVLYLFTDLYYTERYALPVTVFTVPLVVCYLTHLPWKTAWRQAAVVAFTLLIAVQGVCQYAVLRPQDFTKSRREIAEVLTENGYTQGYAAFWEGNILTELTDGQLEVWLWNEWEPEQDGFYSTRSLYHWLQVKEHTKRIPNGKLFVVLDEDKLDESGYRYQFPETAVLCYADEFVVYGFPSYGELPEVLR